MQLPLFYFIYKKTLEQFPEFSNISKEILSEYKDMPGKTPDCNNVSKTIKIY